MDSTANHGLQGCSAWLIRLQNAYAYAYGHITQGLLRLVVIQQSSKVLQFLSLGTLEHRSPANTNSTARKELLRNISSIKNTTETVTPK